ncbi:hypothetical protein QOT17_020376 [Balamuthia mandrillaris]
MMTCPAVCDVKTAFRNNNSKVQQQLFQPQQQLLSLHSSSSAHQFLEDFDPSSPSMLTATPLTTALSSKDDTTAIMETMEASAMPLSCLFSSSPSSSFFFSINNDTDILEDKDDLFWVLMLRNASSESENIGKNAQAAVDPMLKC